MSDRQIMGEIRVDEKHCCELDTRGEVALWCELLDVGKAGTPERYFYCRAFSDPDPEKVELQKLQVVAPKLGLPLRCPQCLAGEQSIAYLRQLVGALSYPVEVRQIDEEGGERYFMAHLPAFGESACSACGDTEEAARARLEEVKQEVIWHYITSGRKLPGP